MVEINSVRCDENSLGGGDAGESRDDGDKGEQPAHGQKKTQVSVMVPM